VLQTTAANYATILATVRALAPSARIVMFNLYNPLAEVLPGSDQLIAVVNQTLAQIATGAHVALADAFRAINGTAGSASERSRLCALTWECSKFQNVHPTTLGYAVMTVALVIAR
jgi:lysophospholipase L1-like esterase